MKPPRQNQVINGELLWKCGICRKFLPRGAYYGKTETPNTYCRSCSKIRYPAKPRPDVADDGYLESVGLFRETAKRRGVAFTVAAKQAFEKWMETYESE